jgi:hypothetical protein
MKGTSLGSTIPRRARQNNPPEVAAKQEKRDLATNELVVAAFVVGVHVRRDTALRGITAHSPDEIIQAVRTQLGLDGRVDVKPEDVVRVYQILLPLIG